MEYIPKTFKELFEGTGIEPKIEADGSVSYDFKAVKKDLDTFMAIKHEQDVAHWQEKLTELCDTLQKERRELEGKILTFRIFLRQGALAENWEGAELSHWLDKFDKHFNIVKYRHGTTE